MSTEAKKRADNKYRRENTKQIVLRFFTSEEDQAIYNWIKSQDNMSQYLKGLVAADMNRHE